MKRYDSYKDTGIAWIGEIPSHWEVKPIKYTAYLYNGDSLNDNQKSLYSNCTTEDSLPYIASKDIERDTEYVDYENGVRIPEYGKGFSVARPNSTLLCIEGGSAGKKMAFINQNICFVNKLCCFDSKLNDKYNYYFICSTAFKEPFMQNLQGMIGGVTISDIKNFSITVPPLKEQEAIADYLDRKCASIDSIIATQERRIALLNELKQSVITEVVTRGINPNAPLRDSGIDWIGQIPEHWQVMKVAHIFNFIGSGTTPSTDIKEYYDENGFNWLQTGDLNDSYIEETSKHVTSYAIDKCNLKTYPIGSLVIAMYGATVGKLGLLKIPTTVNQACCVLPFSSLVNPIFSFYSFLAAKQYLISLSVGGGQPNISQDTIMRHKLPVPSIEEQFQIVEYLDKKCASIDSAIAKAKREIELLKEYKQSVITEAVTGKIKVC